MESAETRNPFIRLVKALGPDSLIKALSGVAFLWAFLPDDGSVAYRIHRAFYRDLWSGAGLVQRLGLFLGFVVSFPVNLGVSVFLTLRCGERVRHETGKGLLKQIGEQFALSSRKAVQSPWYYMFEMYKDEHRARAMEYLYRFETKAALYPTLRKYLSSKSSTEALSDKAIFAEHCRKHGVAAVTALGTMRKGQLKRLDGGKDGLPHCDLFLKPIRGAGGRGASRWIYGQDGLYRGNQGTEFDEAGLIDYLAELSKTEAYVIREFVSNHPDLTDLAGGVLSTVRIVTCLDEAGHPEVMHAVLRVASKPGVVVDNFHAGGVAAAIDLETGILAQATNMGMLANSQWWDRHPVNGAPISGRTLPMWDEVMRLALRAHAIFEDHVAIGWDIAICAQGPLLVEGNKSPDLDILQRVCRQPLGNARFGRLFLHHIERALATAETLMGLDTTKLSSSLPISNAAASTASIFEIAPDADHADAALREQALTTLEHGGVVFLPSAGFELTKREQELVLDAAVILPTRKERESRNGRPTVIYDPGVGHILLSRMPRPGRDELEALMKRYSHWAEALVADLFPTYVGKLALDRLTYRPCERIDPQGLHVDASYGRPTEGRGMLRVFCNINPAGQSRVWRVGETFEPFARRFLPTAKPPHTRLIEGWLGRLGITKGRRTAYDRLMADIRGQVKNNDEYQRAGPQREVSFPSGSAWIAITDLVLHAAMSGQHSFDQTFFLPAAAMREPDRSSLRILEQLGGYKLH